MLIDSIVIMTAILFGSITSTDKIIEIPLSEIWAHQMPETKTIRELVVGRKEDAKLMADIGKEHSSARGKKPAGPALAVEGKGLEALKNAHAVIAGRKPRSDSLSKDNEVSIVFFTLTTGYYVHLTNVSRSRQTIQVRFEFIPHETKDLTQHFALIPMGKLPKGKYQVEVIAEPLAQRFIERKWKEFDDEKKARIISSSFEFEVQ